MSSDYLLGATDAEVRRMRFQHSVWKPLTDAFLDRLGAGKGWSCLDVGAGPGFTTADLRDRVGASGHVTALEPSETYVRALSETVQREGWRNVSVIRGTAESAALPAGAFDLVFARWVLNFVPDRRAFLTSLAGAVKPGGIFAVMDYWYEGLSFYPRGTALDRLADAARGYYRAGGGDAYGIGRMPEVLGALRFGVVETTPLQMTGGAESPAYRWASQFFRQHLPLMADKGAITADESRSLLEAFDAIEKEPGMLFFSPIVMACGMKKAG